MIRFYYTIGLILILTTCFGQKNNQDILVRINTKFTLTLHTTDSVNYTCTLKNQEVYDEIINLSDAASILEKEVQQGEIEGIFTYGKFGDKLNIFLVLKSGLNIPLDYDLKIKVSKKRKPIKTSVVSLNPNVPSTELWPYQIDYILFSGFRVVTPIEYVFPEPTIDSTCIKNSHNNIKVADSLFATYIDTLDICFAKPSGLVLDRVLDFEHSVDSKDITRGYLTSIGEDIYPNKNGFKLEKPIRFKTIECPYFQRETHYYYTKKGNSVKVILFEWNEFKMQDNFLDEGMNLNLRKKVFREKFDTIQQTLTKLFGEPREINIESKDKPEYFRDDMFWESKEGIKADLFMFGNDNNNYRQIRLAIYKD